MQGVDRLDQVRSRFSICDGHSFKKWYIKLALSLIDMVRVNAYLARTSVALDICKRDPQKEFMLSLYYDDMWCGGENGNNQNPNNKKEGE